MATKPKTTVIPTITGGGSKYDSLNAGIANLNKSLAEGITGVTGKVESTGKDLRPTQRVYFTDSGAMTGSGKRVSSGAPTIGAGTIGTGNFGVPPPVNDSTANSALGGMVGVGVSQTGTPTYGSTGAATSTTGKGEKVDDPYGLKTKDATGTTDAGSTYEVGTTMGGKGGDLISQIQKDIEALRGKGEREAELDKLYKVEQRQKELDAIRAEKLTRDRYYENQLRDMQDRGGGLEMGLQGEMDTLQRNRNRELADISIREAVALQDFNTATAIVEKKLKAEFEPIQNEITNLSNLYGLMQNDMSESEQMQAQAIINDKASSKTYAMNSASAAYEMLFNSGAVTPDRLAIISDGIKAATDAISAGKSPMQGVNQIYSALDGVISPTEKSMMLQEAQLAWDKEKYYAGLRAEAAKTTAETLTKEKEAMTQAEYGLLMEKKKQDLIDQLIDENGNPIHQGIKATVGSYDWSLNPWDDTRTSFWTKDKEAQTEFVGLVDQLTAGLTLNELINAKANGATFGALSIPELQLLSNAATIINQARITEKGADGETLVTVGYKLSEADFAKELGVIRYYSDLAVKRRQEGVFSSDEISTIDTMTSGTGTTTVPVVDGSLYYR